MIIRLGKNKLFNEVIIDSLTESHQGTEKIGNKITSSWNIMVLIAIQFRKKDKRKGKKSIPKMKLTNTKDKSG